MRTRINNFLDTSTDPWSPVYSFQYAQTKRPLECDWHWPKTTKDGRSVPATWKNPVDRDRARACFTHRRDPAAAHADLQQIELYAQEAKKEKN